MGDPVSITTGVLTLLGTCLKVGWQLKQFHDGAAISNTKVQSLLTDVEGYTRVLQSMNETFEQEKIKSTLEATGHIGSHWSSLSASIRDGQESLSQLEATLDKANKNVSLLDGARKHMRLMVAADEIVMYQQQIRSYRDTLQLSLQTVILWNQVSFKESTDQVLPNLDSLHREIRRLAQDFNSQISELQALVQTNQSGHEMESLRHLRNTVQSAATVVSSASTIMGVDLDRDGSSEFGDCFPPEPNEAMNRWLSSNTVHEFGEDDEKEPQYGNSGETSQPANNLDGSDSDSDLDAELSQALFKRGVEKLAREDWEGAESLLRKSLARVPGSDLESRCQILTSLHRACKSQKKYADSRAALLEILSFHPKDTDASKYTTFGILQSLCDVLRLEGSYLEAMLYGRRALKGFRKLAGSDADAGIAKSLVLLIKVCQDEGNHDEEEAFTTILSDFQAKAVADRLAVVEETQATPKFSSPLVSAVSPLTSKDSQQSAQYQKPNPIYGKASSSRFSSVEEQRPPQFPPGLDNTESLDKQSTPSIGNNKRLSTTDAIDEILPVPIDALQTLPSLTPNPSTNNPKPDRSVIMLGASGCGKTTFLMHANFVVFSGDWDPGSTFNFNKFTITITANSLSKCLLFFDASGRIDEDRYPGYSDTCISVLAFAIDSPHSLNDVRKKWVTWARSVAPLNSIVLLGLKSDLRNDPGTIEELAKSNQHPVTVTEAQAIKSKIGARLYLECSALTGDGVKEAMEAILEVAMVPQSPPVIPKAEEKTQGRLSKLFGKRARGSLKVK